jgi:hypothetical protein
LLLDRPTDHHRHDAFDARLGSGQAANDLSVAQDRHAIGDLKDFVKAMTDEDDRAAFAQLPNHTEQVADFILAD